MHLLSGFSWKEMHLIAEVHSQTRQLREFVKLKTHYVTCIWTNTQFLVKHSLSSVVNCPHLLYFLTITCSALEEISVFF